MDPSATLTLILEALANDDGAAAIENIQNLRAWLRKGGFAPHLTMAHLEILTAMADQLQD